MSGKKSLKYLLVANLASKFFVLVTSIFVARLLMPEDYGYMVVVDIFYGILSLFTFSGFEAYYIQVQEENKNKLLGILRSVYELRIVFNVSVFVLQVLISLLLLYLNKDILGYLLLILAPINLLTLLVKPGELDFIKKVNFKPIATATGLGDISGSILKLLAAFLGFGPFSFVIGQVCNSIVRTVYLYQKVLIKPKQILKSEIKPLLRKDVRVFGTHSFLSTIGGYVTSQLDRIVVSIIYPLGTVGIYQFSKKQASLFSIYFLKPINTLSMSIMAKNKSNTDGLMELFDKIGFVLNFFVFPIMVFMALYSDILIPMIFGLKWIESVLIFKVFIINYLFTLINYPINGLLTTIGRPDIKARVTIVTAILFSGTLIIMYTYKVHIIYYAISYVCLFGLSDFIVAILSLRLLGFNYFKFLVNRSYFFSNTTIIIVLVFIKQMNVDNYFIIVGAALLCIGLIQLIFIKLLYEKNMVKSFELFFPDKYLNFMMKILRINRAL